MPEPVTAFLDACVLRPLPLADFLLRAAAAGLCRVRWSADVQREWAHALSRQRPDADRGLIDARNAAMNAALPDALVTGYAALTDTLSLPDPDDRHVLAAAIRAGADVIVTYNLRDFPARALARHGVRAQHPDAFLRGLADLWPEEFAAIARQTIAAWRWPPIGMADFFERLQRLRLHRTAAALRDRFAAEAGDAQGGGAASTGAVPPTIAPM
jgi:hypothetical protein